MNLHQYAETHEVTNQPPPSTVPTCTVSTFRYRNGRGVSVRVGPNRGSMPTGHWPAAR